VTRPSPRFPTLILLVAVALTIPPAAAAPIAESTRLAAIYDLILDARFDQAERSFQAGCAPAPPVACDLLAATATWWRIQLDDRSRTLDDAFLEQVNGAIASAEDWTEREPDRSEAWFYLGAAYGARVQWRVLRGERLAAARDGKHIREALERALLLDPDLYDARFGIGLYKYYAAVAPAAAKILRFLLLLPGGNREEGLADMLAARARGTLLRGEADYQLHWIYFWYEDQPQRGLAVLQDLRRRYPHNPLFAQRIAEVQQDYFHDRAASLATWLALLDAADAGQVNAAGIAAVGARLGAAEHFDALGETDRAIDLIEPLLDRPLTSPYGALARAQLAIGTFYDRLGRRANAVSAYRAAVAATSPDDVYAVIPQARQRLRHAPDARKARGYALSLDGWRAFERGATADAAALLDRALALTPTDPIALYRRGRVYRAMQESTRALVALGRVTAAGDAAPPIVLAQAFVQRAEILEAAHDRAGALEAYRRASHVFGADARTRELAARAAARLERAAPEN
jgi:tetratricopeptide (TPR) repeat protein